MPTPLLALSYFVHLLATVVWLGGLLVLAALVWPAARDVLATNPSLYALLSRLRRRFTPWANFSLVLLVVSGLLQMPADPNYRGVLDFGNAWSVALLIKHMAVAGMVAASVALQYGVAPALERASLRLARGAAADTTEAEALRRREVWLTWANLALAALVLGCTALMTAL